MTSNGYIATWVTDHPTKPSGGYVMEHRLVMEDVLGRRLDPTEIVHHRNGIKTDNHHDNLVVMEKSLHDRIPKPPRKPIACPHCGGMIALSGRARKAVAL